MMELAIFENGIETHNDRIQNALNNEGLYVMHEDNYSYTIGMKDLNAPEMIIFGETREVAEEMLLIIYQAVKRNLVKLQSGRALNKVFYPEPQLLSVTDNQKKSHFYSTRLYYGDWNFNVVEVTLAKNTVLN